MRYLVSIAALLLVTFTAVAQTDSVAVVEPQPTAVALDNDQLWERGNQAYIDGDFVSALSNYSAIENSGNYSARLYYNMGNAYFKQNMLGKAILYYNRALVVSPSMDDARYNLEIAEAQTKDKIAVVPEFFLVRWVRTIRSTMSCTAWSVISIVMFGVALALLLLFLLASAIKVRKVGFYGTIVAMLFFVVATAFAISERNAIINRQGAIVMGSAIAVKSSPDSSATDMFVLHEGTKVMVSSEIDGWSEIIIADGKKGWTESSHLERI